MSISYHGVVGHTAKTTLPSVETWGSNMNILRDPPKSIQTRKIDKVGQDSEIVQMQQEGTDRACEAILTYARGVNPMVGVSYSNYGNNGGQRVNQSQTGGIGNTQAFLPYRVIRDGAFRPPAWSARNLLPLSRQPRVWTSSFTKPSFVDYSKTVMCRGTDEQTKGVKNPGQLLKACVRPTATYKIEVPVTENYDVKYVIHNPVRNKLSSHSGIESRGKINGELGDVTMQVINDPLRKDVNMNLGSRETYKDIDISHFNTDKYMQQAIHSNVNVNKSQNIQVTSIEDILGFDGEARTKNQINIDYDTPIKGHEKVHYIHDDVQLSRVLPEYDANTNKGQTQIYKRMSHENSERSYTMNRPTTEAFVNHSNIRGQAFDIMASRDYNLKPTINPGGFTDNVGIPTITRQELTEFDNEKTQMRQKIYEMQQGRHYDNGVNPYNRHN